VPIFKQIASLLALVQKVKVCDFVCKKVGIMWEQECNRDDGYPRSEFSPTANHSIFTTAGDRTTRLSGRTSDVIKHFMFSNSGAPNVKRSWHYCVDMLLESTVCEEGNIHFPSVVARVGLRLKP
jgi:hypothetical protein